MKIRPTPLRGAPAVIPLALMLFLLPMIPADSVVPEARAAGENPAEPGLPVELQDVMKKAMPGEHHAHLAHLVGSWKYTAKIWPQPGADPLLDGGTMEARWVLGKRFVEVRTRGSLMGIPFEGLSLEGYDNIAGRYTTVWADTLGTLVRTFRGTCAEGGKIRTLVSDTVNPINGKPMTMKSVTTVLGPDSFRYELYERTSTGDVKGLELVYNRS